MKRILAAVAAGLATLALAFPFVPTGPTNNLAVTASAQSLTLPTVSAVPAQVSTVSDIGLYSYMVTVVGTQTVFGRCDGVTPTTANATPFLANSQVVISLEKSVTACQFIAANTGSTVYATIGRGE